MKRSRGFTLVELLVVIAIIGILVAMLMPAVQSVREAARRASCLNNVRQIVIGLKNFETSNSHFPAGWQGDVSESELGWGWMSHTLPFVEQGNLYESLNFETKLLDGSQQAPIKRGFPGQLCPSSSVDSPTVMLSTTDSPIGDYQMEIGRTHYVGCVGSSVAMETMADGQTCPSMNLFGSATFLDGMFYKNSETEVRDILDGTSNTIAVGERSSEMFDSVWPGVVTGSEFTGWRVVGWTWEPPNHPMQTEPVVILNEEGEETELEIHFHGFAQFNSMHLGGVTMFGFVDGSARSIDDGIDPLIFRAMGTIRGRETVSQ
jgi:prepilin-type N-terminal cleavage/methylation domain-containing protein